MNVVMSWLQDYIDLHDVGVDDVAERWTLAGLEVSGIERIGDWWDRDLLRVGAVTRVEPHPNADRLVLAWVDLGTDAPHRVVTGAPNLLPLRGAGDLPEPMKVAFAREGAEIFDGHQEGWVKVRLQGRSVRGIRSDAMVCSEKELGLSEDHAGILVLDGQAPVGAPLVEVLGDAVVEIDLTANLARAMNMVGIARETSAILGRPYRVPEPIIARLQGRAAELVDVAIEDADLCPRYTARVIADLAVGPSPAWMARRLLLAGMRPINNVVDVTNYAMLEWGEPLHAFDYDRLVARAGGARPRILVRRAQDGERLTTLDNVDRPLDRDTLLICDAAGPLAIAGIMGGVDSEVTAETRRVLLEAAAFDNINIRRTSKAQKLPSESAARFGRGVHPALADIGSLRAAQLLAEHGCGTVAEGVVDTYPRPPRPVVVSLPPAEVERILGLAIPEREVRAILERLEFAVERAPDGTLRATVPPHRMDVAVAADLLEEVARIHGYDRLPSTLLADTLPPQRDNAALQLEERARDAMVAAGLQEVISYRLVAVEREALLHPGRSADSSAYVVLANPISPERSALRRSILTGLLEAAARNLRFTDRIALFELGPVFHARPGGLPDEPRRLGIVMAGPVGTRGWRGGEQRPMDFYDAKGAAETLLEALGLVAVEWRPGSHPSLHPGRCAEVAASGRALGNVGELHPVVREQWDLGSGTVAVADLDVDALQSIVAAGERPFVPFSPFPPVRQDLAVVVDEDTPAAEVAAVIRGAGKPLLAGLALFDVYRGRQVGARRKSLAWALTFQAPDRTLESGDADEARRRIVKALRAKLEAEMRE